MSVDDAFLPSFLPSIDPRKLSCVHPLHSTYDVPVCTYDDYTRTPYQDTIPGHHTFRPSTTMTTRLSYIVLRMVDLVLSHHQHQDEDEDR